MPGATRPSKAPSVLRHEPKEVGLAEESYFSGNGGFISCMKKGNPNPLDPQMYIKLRMPGPHHRSALPRGRTLL